MRINWLTVPSLCFLVAAALNAQSMCDKPGAAFGITAYRCDSCTVERKNGARPTWVFHSRPTILEATTASGFRRGDTIQAVNGKSITTAAGAKSFVYPPKGVARVTVRRAGVKRDVSVSVPTGCDGIQIP